MEETRAASERAERDGDLEKAAELRFGRIVELERQIEEENERLQQIQSELKMLNEEVTEEDVAAVVAKWTGIPVSRLLEGEMQKLVHLEEALHERVVGQDAAVGAVANAIRRARAGLQDPNRPIGSFLFLGPTGVGKTELARALAEFLFDDERAMIRIDMSEYQERHTVSRLVGAPPGYVGFEEGGQLTEAVRRRPYSVVLLDEIEKAHTDVFNVLLQLLDDGRLTDGQGRTVDFRNTIVIMTSNLGAAVFQDQTASPEEREEKVMADVRAHFRPEFINRIDEVVVFDALSRDDIVKIVEIQLRGFQQRLADRKLQLELTDEAKTYLANAGYDPHFGARPLKRLIQHEIQDPLAMLLLSGEVREGDTVVVEAGAARAHAPREGPGGSDGRSRVVGEGPNQPDDPALARRGLPRRDAAPGADRGRRGEARAPRTGRHVVIRSGCSSSSGGGSRCRPRRELHRYQARSLSLRSAPGDPLGYFERPFALLGHAATAKDIENTSWGTWHGMEVVVIDYWFARSSDPSRSDYRYYTCAATPVPSAWPNLSIVPEELGSRLATAMGVATSSSSSRASIVRSRSGRTTDGSLTRWSMPG